ncbi:MAG: hypothetical protein MJB14_15025 [Spirochaetes bacterium]|nr:hypothetical protein [Spirochaetota bacterium]
MKKNIPDELMHDFFQDQIDVINHYIKERRKDKNIHPNQLALEWIAHSAYLFRMKWIEKNCK